MHSTHARRLHVLAAPLKLSGFAFAQGDDCSSALPIAGTGTWSFDTSTATTSTFDGGSGGSGCFNDVNQDVFYAWTCPASGDYVLDTNTTTWDTKLNVHTGADCNAACLAGDDDGGQGLQRLPSAPP